MPNIFGWVKVSVAVVTATLIAVAALVILLSGKMLDQEDEYANYRDAVISALMDAYKFLKRDRVFSIMDQEDQTVVVMELTEHVLKAAFKIIPRKHCKRLLADAIEHMTKVTSGEIS